MKKFIYSLTVLFALLPFIVDAKTIKAGGVTLDGDNISGLRFNDSTNTITLDGYNGGNIIISEFETGSTVNINIVGENIVTGPDLNTDAISINSDINVIFNGSEDSTLTIKNAYNGIYADYANFEVNNAKLIFNNLNYCIMYTYNRGSFEINNSIIDSTNAVYGIDTYDGDIIINNSEVIFDGGDYLLFAYGKVDMDNSLLNIKNTSDDYGIYIYDEDGSTSTIKNSKITIDGIEYPVYSYNSISFIDSDIHINNAYYGFYFEDSCGFNITASFDNTKLKITDSVYGFDLYGSLEFKNKSDIKMFISGEGAYLENYYRDDNVFSIVDSTVLIENAAPSDTDYKDGICVYLPLKIVNSKIDINGLDAGILNYTDDLEIKDSEVNITSDVPESVGILSEEHKVTFDNTKFHVKTDSLPIIVISEEDSNAKIEIKGKSYFEDKDIKPLVYELDNYYTVLGKKVDPTITTVEELYENGGLEISLLMPEEPKEEPKEEEKKEPKEEKEDVPETVDNIIMHVILGTLSVSVLGTIIFNKKNRKELV